MVRSKAPSKKQQKRGIDFKKIKRKIGRKLPPPNNATNTEIKSKAIILPEQSVASEKAGLAVNKKGLTLKELLQQTSHHNSKIRKDALRGVRDLLMKYPTELRLHRYAVIEKLRERISDDDKVVRETLYQLLKSVIFPGCKEENQGLFISLLMVYIFNAMTHLSIDVRIMAFKFFELVVEYYPSSFFMYADKILQNYEEILQKNQFYLQDKGQLKNALTGLVHCLSLLPSNKREIGSSKNVVAEEGMLHAFEPDMPAESVGPCVNIENLEDLVLALLNCFQEFMPVLHNATLLNAQAYDCMLYVVQSIHLAVGYFLYVTEYGKAESLSSCEESSKRMEGTISSALSKNLLSVFPLTPSHHLSEKDNDRFLALNIVITEIFLHSRKCIKSPDAIFEKFLEFIENSMQGKIISGLQSGKAVREKHVLPLLPFIPKLVEQVTIDWKLRLLKGFTLVFKDCHPESSLKLACLKVILELLVPRGGVSCLDARFPEILELQVAWIGELPFLLILLGDKHPSCSEVVLHLLLRVGQYSFVNSPLQWEYDNTQYPLQEFYSMKPVKGNLGYGPFTQLPTECQKLSICCLYYFSYLDPLLLKSLASCCLCPELHPDMLFLMMDVLHSTYKVGHIQIADYISFCVTLLSRFEDYPEYGSVAAESNKKNSNYGTLKSITRITCSCLSQIGDNFVVFKTLENVIVDQISIKPPLDNACALLRILVSLDSQDLRLSEQSIITLSNFLPGYMIDAVQCAHKDTKGFVRSHFHRCRYYLLPCFFLFHASRQLLSLVLQMMGSSLSESSFGSSHDSTSLAMDPSSLISSIVSILLLMHKDTKAQRSMESFKAEIDDILQNILRLQTLDQSGMTIEGRHKVQCAVDDLKILICALPNRNAT